MQDLGILFFKRSWNKSSAHLFELFLFSNHGCLVLLLFVDLSSIISPGIKGNSIVHHQHEGIYSFSYADHICKEELMIVGLLFLILNSLSNSVDLVLCDKFFDLHSFTKLEVTILTPHTSIK